MKTELVQITPKMATDLLRHNTINRKLKPDVVNEYAGYMLRGEWKISHQPIGISETGKLLDGQHRLHGIIKSGKTVSIFIVRGLKDDVMTVIDTGARRTTGDAFGLLEVPQANNIAAAIQVFVKLKNNYESFVVPGGGGGKTKGIGTLSNQEKYNLYVQNENVINACLQIALKCYAAVRFYTMSQIMGISMFLILEKKHSLNKVTDFWLNIHMIKTDKIPACKVLSSVLLKYITGSEKMKSRYKSAITVKSWNGYLKGDNIKVLKFSDQEKFPEFI